MELHYPRGVIEMIILKEGTLIKLYGECPGCHAVVETDTKESLGHANKDRFVICPTCGFTVSVHWKIIGLNGVTWGGRIEPTPFDGVLRLDSGPSFCTGYRGGYERGVHVYGAGLHAAFFIPIGEARRVREFFNNIDIPVS